MGKIQEVEEGLALLSLYQDSSAARRKQGLGPRQQVSTDTVPRLPSLITQRDWGRSPDSPRTTVRAKDRAVQGGDLRENLPHWGA